MLNKKLILKHIAFLKTFSFNRKFGETLLHKKESLWNKVKRNKKTILGAAVGTVVASGTLYYLIQHQKKIKAQIKNAKTEKERIKAEQELQENKRKVEEEKKKLQEQKEKEQKRIQELEEEEKKRIKELEEEEKKKLQKQQEEELEEKHELMRSINQRMIETRIYLNDDKDYRTYRYYFIENGKKIKFNKENFGFMKALGLAGFTHLFGDNSI